MKWNRWVLVAAALLGIQSGGFASEKEPSGSTLPAGAPIVIQNLHVDRIENLTVHVAAPTALAPERLGTIERRNTVASKAILDRRPERAPEELSRRGDRDSPLRKKGLEIHVFSVGQGDSQLIIGPPDAGGKRKNMLIDVGESSLRSKNYVDVGQKVRELTGGNHLDYFVATHFHNDHLGGPDNGIAGLLNELNFTIDTVMDVSNQGSTYFGQASRSTYDTYEETMSSAVGGKVHKRVKPQFGREQIKLGGNVIVEILAFAGKVSPDDPGVLAEVERRFPGHYATAPPSENDLSIAMKISSGKFEYFSGGDMTGAEDTREGERLFSPRFDSTYTNVESWMVKSWRRAGILENVEVYRANHHGSSFSTTPELLDNLHPEFVIYSCAKTYDHPSRPVVERVAPMARQFVTTALSPKSWPDPSEFAQYNGEVVGGDIEIYVDTTGSWYWINNELHRAYSDEEEAQGKDIGEANRVWTTERE